MYKFTFILEQLVFFFIVKIETGKNKKIRNTHTEKNMK